MPEQITQEALANMAVMEGRPDFVGQSKPTETIGAPALNEAQTKHRIHILPYAHGEERNGKVQRKFIREKLRAYGNQRVELPDFMDFIGVKTGTGVTQMIVKKRMLEMKCTIIKKAPTTFKLAHSILEPSYYYKPKPTKATIKQGEIQLEENLVIIRNENKLARANALVKLQNLLKDGRPRTQREITGATGLYPELIRIACAMEIINKSIDPLFWNKRRAVYTLSRTPIVQSAQIKGDAILTVVQEIPEKTRSRTDKLVAKLNALTKGTKVIINAENAGFLHTDACFMALNTKINKKVLRGKICVREKQLYFEKE